MMPFENSSHSFLSILNWNIRNPSVERADKQLSWLLECNVDVLVLTECKRSPGCSLIQDSLKAHGYHVTFPEFDKEDYGVLIATKNAVAMTQYSSLIGHLPSRVASVLLTISGYSDSVEIIGTYVPSRDVSEAKKYRKQIFLAGLLDAFKAPSPAQHRIFCGDLNIVDRNHFPQYKVFEKWEYDFYDALHDHGFVDAFCQLNPEVQEHSWVGRTGNGYRYDYVFTSSSLVPQLVNCYYLHEPRLKHLSDHSALTTKFKLLRSEETTDET
jgi:exodeoxyribonuclease-3